MDQAPKAVAGGTAIEESKEFLTFAINRVVIEGARYEAVGHYIICTISVNRDRDGVTRRTMDTQYVTPKGTPATVDLTPFLAGRHPSQVTVSEVEAAFIDRMSKLPFVKIPAAPKDAVMNQRKLPPSQRGEKV